MLQETIKMKLTYIIWLERNAGRAFGEGPYLLLKGVEATGSPSEAAAGMGMAYSKARRVMGCCEQNLGFALTSRKIGGVSGGGSEVTAEATVIMKKYEALREEIRDVLGEAYKRHFGESVDVQFYKMITHKRIATDAVRSE
jgi:molybdate transport system regulatory protein